MAKWIERFKNGWNAFIAKDSEGLEDDLKRYHRTFFEGGSSWRPDRPKMKTGNERSIINSVMTRIAVDVAQNDIRHVRLDENGRFIAYIEDELDKCLHVEANIDQSGREFIQDAVMSMLDEGVVALVPVDIDVDPRNTDSYTIQTMRTAKIVQWFPYAIDIDAYDDRKGVHRQCRMLKDEAAICQNPFYSVMNQPNSTLQRLIRKLNLLDTIDNKTGSDKIDLIIQLPYPVRTEAQRQKANDRVKDIEDQLSRSQYGIAYVDATEHVTQLNRSIENNLLKQVEYLHNLFYTQMGVTEDVLNGKADEEEMQNYTNRIVVPILNVLVESLRRKFLTQTARTQGQSIMYFTNPFKFIPASKLADLSDKLTRNAILSSNEIRGLIGFAPVDDPDADALRNKNLNMSEGEQSPSTVNTKDGGAATSRKAASSSRSNAGKAVVDRLLGLQK